jgi:uncharacterized membrane protein YqhA
VRLRVPFLGRAEGPDRRAIGNEEALQHILEAVAVPGAPLPTKLNETTIMLVVLGLIDVVMISNLLIMVIVGGYETFVSRMNLEGHPDQPEWLSHVNASVLKTKLAMAIIGISSIHLLKTFINAAPTTSKVAHRADRHPPWCSCCRRWRSPTPTAS